MTTLQVKRKEMGDLKTENRKALSIGAASIGVYLVNYYLRHLLSVLTPQMTATAAFTKSGAALLSSTYMIFYAAGQLLNGLLGDRFSPKKMVFCGLFAAGAVAAVFPFVGHPVLQIACFAVFGFGLSMVRGPLMKVISENTAPDAARIICVFFSFASFAGPLIASLFALLFRWQWAFVAAGAVAMAAAVAAYLVLTALERRSGLTYQSTKGQGIRSLGAVFGIEHFFFYMVIACLVEIGAASVSFWIPTYLTERLGFARDTANMIYSGISVVRSLMPFAALAIFRATGGRDIAMMRVTFLLAAVLFGVTAAVNSPWWNIAFLLLALMCMSCCSALLWSIYIPGLGKTGRVSSANGILDCAGYVAASAANMLFAGVLNGLGWSGVSLLWAGIGAVGVAVTFFAKNNSAKS